MQFTSLAALASLLAVSFATPAHFSDGLVERQATLVCASGTPQCCDVDVLGVADLDCSTRMSSRGNELLNILKEDITDMIFYSS